MIGGLEYVYSLELVYHKEFHKKMKYTPGKALNFIKQHALWCEGI